MSTLRNNWILSDRGVESTAIDDTRGADLELDHGNESHSQATESPAYVLALSCTLKATTKRDLVTYGDLETSAHIAPVESQCLNSPVETQGFNTPNVHQILTPTHHSMKLAVITLLTLALPGNSFFSPPTTPPTFHLSSTTSSTFDLPTYLKETTPFIESSLSTCLEYQSIPQTKKITEAMYYSLLAGGKRIRPVACLLSYDLFSKKNNKDLKARRFDGAHLMIKRAR